MATAGSSRVKATGLPRGFNARCYKKLFLFLRRAYARREEIHETYLATSVKTTGQASGLKVSRSLQKRPKMTLDKFQMMYDQWFLFRLLFIRSQIGHFRDLGLTV